MQFVLKRVMKTHSIIWSEPCCDGRLGRYINYLSRLLEFHHGWTLIVSVAFAVSLAFELETLINQ